LRINLFNLEIIKMARTLATSVIVGGAGAVTLASMLLLSVPAPGLSLFIFKLISQFGLWSAAVGGIAIIKAACDDQVKETDSRLGLIAATAGGFGLFLTMALVVPTSGYDISKQLVKVNPVTTPLPNSNPNSVRDMPVEKVAKIFTRTEQAKPPYLGESEPIPAYYADGRRVWAIQQIPNKLQGKLTGAIPHYLVEEDPSSPIKGKLTLMFKTDSTSFGGWYDSDMRHVLQKAKTYTHFHWEDQKYIQLKDGWHLAIPYSDLKRFGLQNDYVYSGVALVNDKGIQYISREENREDLKNFPVAPTSHIDTMFAGYNNLKTNNYWSSLFSNTNEVEGVQLTNFNNKGNNFQVGEKSGFFQGFEPLGSSTQITSFVNINGFKADVIDEYNTTGLYTPDELITKVDGAFVNKYNAVFGPNTASSFERSNWAQVIIKGKVWYTAFLVNSTDIEKYKGVIAFHANQADVNIDDPNSFVFIASENGVMGDKLTSFMKGDSITSDYLIPSGVVNNQGSQSVKQNTPVSNSANTEILKELVKIQNELKEIRKENAELKKSLGK
jgi:hypothetical protein